MSYKITDEEINKVKLNSPFALPDSPTERGMKPGAIKEMFWKPFLELMSLINSKLGELDNSSKNCSNELSSQIGDVASNLSAHDVDNEAHKDIREELSVISNDVGTAKSKAKEAYNLASGKRAVHYEQTMQFAFLHLCYDSESLNDGDMIVIGAKGVPDLIVFKSAEPLQGATIVEHSQIEENTLPEIVPGGKYRLDVGENGKNIGFVAIESSTNIDTSVFATKEKLEEVESIAKGANQAKSFDSYEAMIEEFNDSELTPYGKYNVGQNLMIFDLNVPDLWISGSAEFNSPYVWTTKEAFLNELLNYGVRIGHYYLSPLETQKVDLTDYATKEELNRLETTVDDGFSGFDTYVRDKFSVISNDVGTAKSKAEEAYNLASGKTRVRVVPNFYYMVLDLINSGVNAGDMYLLLDKNVPDFIVMGNGEGPGAITITRDDLYSLPAPNVGDIFFVEGISVAAIESGIDTSVFATKEELEEFSGAMPLLKEVTLDANEEGITIEFDKPLKEFFILGYFSVETTMQNNIRVKTNGGNQYFVLRSITLPNTPKYWSSHSKEIATGYWETIFQVPFGNLEGGGNSVGTAYTSMSYRYAKLSQSNSRYISDLTISVDDTKIVAGSTFKIFGREVEDETI